MLPRRDERIPILYLAPWVDVGGSDKGTIDWFRFLDRDRFRPSLITTQPSANRRLDEIVPYADEVWDLPQLMAGDDFARFIVAFILTRRPQVIHIMNARLGFELLPEIANLPERPATVVQLHVEEADRSGYVRYVTTRYGTLVDAFSVSSRSLAVRLDAYEVPRAKRRVIRTGVDAEHEFSPQRVVPAGDLDGTRFQILFAARLTAQKDPLLMLDVAARLRTDGVAFQIQVLGDGELMDALRRRVAAEGLRNDVIFHGDQPDIAPWYRACDAVLLTSAYEGVPYVAYEAMAMATPVIGPRLDGLAELVDEETAILVSPRDRADGYAEAIRALAADPGRARRMGEAARRRALSELSLTRMGAEHGVLYDELLARRAGTVTVPAPAATPEPVARPDGGLRGRHPGASPLVSVIVPCFNHGRYLNDCLRSVAGQDYPALEVIVVDDGSTDPDTVAALARIERGGEVTVLRMAANGGPSAARNAAIEHVRGRYVLPVDADNLLLPGAVTALVNQLAGADERIGFVYPNYQFFGNRTDYSESPSYNLHSLLSANYCDTSSLLDRELLDRGFRYPEDIVLGHEDWDLVLSLAEQGIYGEPARDRTLLYRKHAFTRSDIVEAGSPFAAVVADRHPGLFAPAARVLIKGEWNPAVTVIALDPLPEASDDAVSNLVASAARQSCQDFDLIVRTADELWPTGLGGRLRRIPTAVATSRGQALAGALQSARGRWLLATYGSPAELLADPGLIEKILRVLTGGVAPDALALGEGRRRLSPFRVLDASAAAGARLAALCWASSGASAPPPDLEVAGDHPLATLARSCSAHGRLQYRHLARRDRPAIAAGGGDGGARLTRPRLPRRLDARIRAAAPELPGWSSLPGRLAHGVPWVPPLARLLCRHYEHRTGGYVLTNDPSPPPGCSFHYVLGCVRSMPLAGTLPLTSRPDRALPVALGEASDPDAAEFLGFVEQAPLPLFDALQIARLPGTALFTLIAGGDDPLAGAVQPVMTIGFIEGHPVHPRHAANADPAYGMVGLVRAVDDGARRHRYGAGRIPPGRLAGELGALLTEPIGDCSPLWIDDRGRVSAPGMPRSAERPSPQRIVRWAGEPLTWNHRGSAVPKLRAAARRVYDGAIRCAVGSDAPPSAGGAAAGYLFRAGSAATIGLYAAVHPVTGDQLLSTNERELRAMGYADGALLGYLAASAPVTGRLGTIPIGVPWARRFGLTAGST